MEAVDKDIEHLIHQGRYIEARNKAKQVLAGHSDLRVQQLYALAMSKSGAPEEAREFLEPIHRQNTDDSETAGILGSIYKELFKKSQDPSLALLSRDKYLKNFEATKNYYTGINAASMSAIVMQASKSKNIAREVAALIREETEDFWETATLGEAYLLLKESDKSLRYYSNARKQAGSDWGKVTSIHNQLWLLNHFIPVPGEIQKMFSPPSVVAFAGHMIDHPESLSQRFPSSIEKQVKDAIGSSLRSLNANVAYCSLACGSDILFAEAMAEMQGEVNIFIPFELEDYLNVSVRFAGQEWVERFRKLADQYRVTLLCNEPYLGHNDLFTLQSKIIFGAAMLRSRLYHSQPNLLTVLSEVDLKRAQGGTRDTLRHWPLPKNHININPDRFHSSNPVAYSTPNWNPTPPSVDRPVLHLIMIKIAALNNWQREKLDNLLQGVVSGDRNAYTSHSETENRILVACGTETAQIELVQLLLKFREQYGGLSAVLHAGPTFRSQGKLAGATVDILRALSENSPELAISASGHVAALFALNAESISTDYAGVFTFQEVEHVVFRLGGK